MKLELSELDAGNELELTYDGSRGSRTVRGYVAHVETTPAILDKYETDYEVRIGTPDDHTPRFLRLSFETTPEEEESGTYSFEENYEHVRSMNSKSSRGQRLGRVEDVTVTDETDARGVQVADLRTSEEGDLVRLGDREATVLDTSGHGVTVEFENGDRESVYYSAERGVYYSVIDAENGYEKTTHVVEFENTGYENTPTDGEAFVWDRTTDYGTSYDRGKVEALVIEGDRYEVVYRPTDSDDRLRLRSPTHDDENTRPYDTTLVLEPTGLRMNGTAGNDLEPTTLDASEVELVYENDGDEDDDDRTNLDADEDDDRDDADPEDALDRDDLDAENGSELPEEGDRVSLSYENEGAGKSFRSGEGVVENVRVSPGVGVEIAVSGLWEKTAYVLLHPEDPDEDRLFMVLSESPEGRPEPDARRTFPLHAVQVVVPAEQVENPGVEEGDYVRTGGEQVYGVAEVEDGRLTLRDGTSVPVTHVSEVVEDYSPFADDDEDDDEEQELVTDGGRPLTRCVLCGFRPEGPTEGLTTLPEDAVPDDPLHSNEDVPATAESPPGAVWVCHGCRDEANPDDSDLPNDSYPRRVECPACSGTAWAGFYSEEVEVGRPTNTNSRGAVAPHYETTTVRFCEFRCMDCNAHDRIAADRAVLLRGPSDPSREEAERVELDRRTPPSDPPEPTPDAEPPAEHVPDPGPPQVPPADERDE